MSLLSGLQIACELYMKKETGIDTGDSRFRALLKRTGYRYRRPKRDLGHLQDKAAKAQAAEVLEELKKGSRRRFRKRFFVDATTVSLDPPLRACWMKIGQQKRIPATRPGTKQHRHIFGAYNWLQDTITWTSAERKNSATFISFLEEWLVNQYPTGRIVLVMDNASYHQSALCLGGLKLFEHRLLMVVWFPRTVRTSIQLNASGAT